MSAIDLPEHWLNIVGQIPYDLPPPLDKNDERCTLADLGAIYSAECARIERLDAPYADAPFVDIPNAVLEEYRKYRPTPLQRARGLERALGFRGEIWFKREDLNPTGSHKPNTAIPQAWYAREQGLRELVTDTGAGQWGAALAWACHNQGLACTVFMTRNSYLSKPYRRHLMGLSGAAVLASPSQATVAGRALLVEDPAHRGSLGIGMGEAMEYLGQRDDVRLALGCMSYYAALHQTVIGQEAQAQLAAAGVEPDLLIGCVGGGTNFVGFVAPFVPGVIAGAHGPRLRAVESANVPVLTKGVYSYEHADSFGYTPRVKMYTLGRSFVPDELHAGGLRYHGKSPILSLLVREGHVEATAVEQSEAFRAARLFFESEGILVAPESAHAVAEVVREARLRVATGSAGNIVFCLSGTGYLDLQSYASEFGLPG